MSVGRRCGKDRISSMLPPPPLTPAALMIEPSRGGWSLSHYGIAMEVETFESLKAETARCPHCLQVHRLAEIRAWLVQSKDSELAPSKLREVPPF